MKKLVAMLLCCVMAFSFVACGDDKGNKDSQQQGNNSSSEKDSQQGNSSGGEKDSQQEDSSGAGQESQGGDVQPSGDALSLLTTIWDKFPEQFFCYGGNMGGDVVENGPGKYNIADKDGMTYTMLVPESVQGNIDDGANLIHMMNANTFTSAVFHVTGDVAGTADAIKETVLNNQFMCGFPDKLVVLTAGDYVLYAFGGEELIDNFASIAKENISGASEVYNDFF